uniref:Cytochrome c7-like domain-containing protein n=1 Tax=Ammonifex degensii TaxID=42838 RepID=A0A7C1F3D2_9THEO
MLATGFQDPPYYTGAPTPCTQCHQDRYAYKIKVHPAGNAAYHNTTGSFDTCKSCHKQSLVDEHGTRRDAAGNLYNCDTCHKSTNTLVQQAIANKQKNCGACHTVGASGHGPAHDTTNLDSKCTTCHNNNLYEEHMNNTKTQTKTLTCGTCHDATAATNPIVFGAIDTENKQCAACHRTAHNISIAEKVNADIPLYSKFTWTTPIDAQIWKGESWVTDEFLNGGKVVISSRSSAVTGQDVWAFYRDNLTAAGWTAPPAPADYTSFSVTFTKGKHKAMIMFTSGELYGSSGVADSYRVIILYK